MAQKRKHYDKQLKMPAAQVVLGVKMRIVDLARELGTKDSTLRQWAQECEEIDEDAIRNVEANQLRSGGTAIATASHASSPDSAKAAAEHMPVTCKTVRIIAKGTVGASS